jgi:hypothetical protein
MHYIVDVKDQQDILCPISCWNRVGFCNHTWFVREIYASVFVDSNKVLVPPLKNTSLQAIKLAQSTNFWETQIIKGCRPCRRPRKNRLSPRMLCPGCWRLAACYLLRDCWLLAATGC